MSATDDILEPPDLEPEPCPDCGNVRGACRCRAPDGRNWRDDRGRRVRDPLDNSVMGFWQTPEGLRELCAKFWPPSK